MKRERPLIFREATFLRTDWPGRTRSLRSKHSVSSCVEWGYISFTELKQIRIPSGTEVDCELSDPPFKASEIEEIRTTRERMRTRCLPHMIWVGRFENRTGTHLVIKKLNVHSKNPHLRTALFMRFGCFARTDHFPLFLAAG